MKVLLRFEEISKSGKTKSFAVYSNHSEDWLGDIHWRNGWRCYVMSYERNIDMSIGCMEELINFMKRLDIERKIKEKQEASA